MKTSRFHCGLRLLLATALLVSVGCRSVHTVDSDRVQAFSTGVTAVKGQSQLTFAAANDLAAAAIFDYAAAQPTLKRTNLFVMLEPASVAVWEDTFSALEKYSQYLSRLTSPTLTDEFDESAGDLALQFQTTATTLQKKNVIPEAPTLSPGLATAFTKIGELVLRAKAQRNALKVMTATDPQVRQIFVAMADALGGSTKEGIRGTVAAHWRQLEAAQQVKFLETPAAGRRPIVEDFYRQLAAASAQDLDLASLRRSLLALAEAHQALSVGDTVNLRAAVAIVSGEVQSARKLHSDFKAKLNQP